MLNLLGLVAQHKKDYGRATALFDEGLALRRELGDTRGIAASLNNLGEVARVQADFGRAASLFAESLALFRGLGEKYATADVLIGLGMALVAQGDEGLALPVYVESLDLFRAVGSTWGVAYSLEGIAAVAYMQGEPARGARLCGAAVALRDVIGAPLPPLDRAAYDRMVDAARAALGDEAFGAAWAEGRALSLDRAIAEAAPDATPA
jgi:tetratricopeptide (TPR) repeat protein